jgi:hypothetical protein
MASLTTESGLRKVNLRAAAGLIRRARRCWIDLVPALLTVRLTKKSARRLLADLRAKGVRQVRLLVAGDNVGFWMEAAR